MSAKSSTSSVEALLELLHFYCQVQSPNSRAEQEQRLQPNNIIQSLELVLKLDCKDIALEQVQLNSKQQLISRELEKWQNEDLHGFVDKSVELFKNQRTRGYQFAVLILLPSKNITRDFTLLAKTRIVTHPDEVTNRFSPTFPSKSDYCNFITARPSCSTHAEIFLMNQVETLMRAYSTQQYLPRCQTILLYTWLFPCDGCKRKIIQILQTYTNIYQVILVYTSDMSEDKVRRSTSELEQTGIDVRKEKYDQLLKPRIKKAHD